MLDLHDAYLTAVSYDTANTYLVLFALVLVQFGSDSNEWACQACYSGRNCMLDGMLKVCWHNLVSLLANHRQLSQLQVVHLTTHWRRLKSNHRTA